MKTIEHKFINDLIQPEKEQTFSGRSIIGKNKLLVVGIFNPEAMINSSLKGLKKEAWILSHTHFNTKTLIRNANSMSVI